MNREFWLEFGAKDADGWEDVFWYNEGEIGGIRYFLFNLFSDLFKRGRYYKVRWLGLTLYLKRSSLAEAVKEGE